MSDMRQRSRFMLALDLALLPLAVGFLLGCPDQSDNTDSGDDAGLDGATDADEAGPEHEPATWVWDILSPLGRQYAYDLDESENGGVYLGGYHDPDDGRGWAAHIARDGEVRWSLLIGDWVDAVTAHPEGGVLLGGRGGAVTSSGFVVHIDADGDPNWQLEWEQSEEHHGPSRITAISATADGTFIIAGPLEHRTTPDTSLAWMAEMTGQGELLWQRVLFESSFYGAAIAIARDSDILFATGGEDGLVWLARLDKDGQPRWARRYQRSPSTQVTRIGVVETTDGDVVLVDHATIVRYEANGTLRWQRTLESVEGGQATSGLALADGALLLAGVVMTQPWAPNLMLAWMDEEGELFSQRSLDFEGCEVARNLVLGRDGNAITATGGCAHTLVLRFETDGDLGEDCDLFRAFEMTAAPGGQSLEEVEILPTDAELTPVLGDVTSSPNESNLSVLCES